MAGGKPKNDGQLLTVRISTEAHTAIGEVLLAWTKQSVPPKQRTKTAVVEAAVKLLAVLDGERVEKWEAKAKTLGVSLWEVIEKEMKDGDEEAGQDAAQVGG